MYAYERITDPAGFAAIEDEWRALAEACGGGGVFASHAFLLSWAETFGQGRRLAVSLLRHKGALVGALPMFHTGQARAVAAMGEGRAGMAQWLLHPDLPDADAALAALLRPDWLSFWRLEPLETPDAEALERAARRAGLAVRRKATMRACSVTTEGDFDSYLGGLKSKTRQVFRRSERKLAEMEVRDLRSDRDGRAALDAYLAASRASWKGLTGTGYGAAPEGVAFVEKLFERLGPEACYLAARQVGEVAISGRFVLVHDNMHYGLANDFNEEYADLAVGRNSIMQSVRDAFEGGAAGFDFTRCNGLVREVSTDERPLERVLIHRRGDPTLAAFFAARGLRRLRRKASGWQKGRRGVVS